jgi:hypothetical protein
LIVEKPVKGVARVIGDQQQQQQQGQQRPLLEAKVERYRVQ